ncbi:MAG: phosphoenolpyruvate kinase [Gemmatimonadota bacterium]|nr:phosphoenolpyruvate kinase [Gemmatimonadota bacterium]
MADAAAVPTSLDVSALESLAAPLQRANARFGSRHPGESARRQPVHTVYGGGHLFRSDSAGKLGAVALRSLEENAGDAETFARAIGLDLDPSDRTGGRGFAERVYGRVIEKLRREPVEDFRIDFEDGYGTRPDAEEDAHVAAAAREVATGMRERSLPPFIGIRIKPLSEELRRRSTRSLDIFLTVLARESGGALPSGFVVTLPKVTIPEQVEYFVSVLDRLEKQLGLAAGSLRFEMMVETPQIIIDAAGRCALPALHEAAAGRMIGAHFGTYDYTAGVNITAAHQHMQHPACAHALEMMQVAFAGTDVWLSDGSTAILPVPPHRGPAPTASERAENVATVHRAWKRHYSDVQNSLMRGFYQGWDLHPAQLPTRYAAVFAFFMANLDAAGARLRNFVEKSAQATLVGDTFDDAATGQGLLNYFVRGINCGAITEAEALAMTSLTVEELRGRSFIRILKNRQL